MVTLPEARHLSDGEGVLGGVKEALMGKLRRGVEGSPGGTNLDYRISWVTDRPARAELSIKGPGANGGVC